MSEADGPIFLKCVSIMRFVPNIIREPLASDLSDNNSLQYFSIGIAYLISSLPFAGWVYLTFSIIGFIYWTIKRADDLVILVLLLGSSFSFTGLNIWNSGIIPGLPFILLLISIFIRGVRLQFRTVIIVVFVIFFFAVLSFGNVFHVGVFPVIVDLMVISSIPLAIYRFKDVTESDFFSAFAVCTVISLIRLAIFSFLAVENPILSTYTDAKFLDTFDELTGFYLLFSLFLISRPNRFRMVTLFALLMVVMNYLLTDNWLGYYGIGSQVLLALIFFLFFLLLRSPMTLFVIIAAIFFVFPLISLYAEDSSDLKIMQLMAVTDILAGLDISFLPHSVHVRVAEITTFMSGEWYRLVFGAGLGGYIPISSDFPIHLGPDDFSEQQISSGLITTPHNLGYLLIKFGWIGAFLAVVLLTWVYRSTRQMSALKFAIYMTFFAFLLLNLGYTLKISFLLGILWLAVKDHKSKSAYHLPAGTVDGRM